MKTVISIGSKELLLSKPLTNDQLAGLLNLLAGVREVDTKHTDDYRQCRIVIYDKPASVRVTLENEPEFMEEKDWRVYKANYDANPPTKEAA